MFGFVMVDLDHPIVVGTCAVDLDFHFIGFKILFLADRLHDSVSVHFSLFLSKNEI